MKEQRRIEQLSGRVKRLKEWLLEVPEESEESGQDRRPSFRVAQNGDSLPALALLNHERFFTYVDDTFARVFKTENCEELLNRSWRCLFSSETEKRFGQNVLPRLSKQGSWRGSFRGKVEDGTKLELSLVLTQTKSDEVLWRITGVEETEKGAEEMNQKPKDQSSKGQGEEKIASLRKGLAELQKCETKGNIYNTALEIANKILDCDFCLLYLREESTLVAKGNMNGQGDEEPIHSLMGGRLSFLTLKKDEVIHGDDLSRYTQRSGFPDQFDCFASVPIDSLGTLQVFSTKQGQFDEVEVDFLQILANHLRERIARAELEGEVREKAIRDQLTGLYNRHYLSEVLAKEVERAQRYDHTISFLMADINGFKEVNDRYSHTKGDQVLKDIGKILMENVREVDTVFRYGGDEFLILLPETGDGSQVVAKRLKKQIRSWSEETEELDFPLSISIGSSNFEPETEVDVEEKISEADRKMYEDKPNRSSY